ncbi:type II toxin-antitoxin system RelE/ParE family toxin [Halomonas sp. EGI 63088]|uniref:Type II toxin-antitoxin system RelE/ParE family toxin n=1 Tax=Halomonas flagellata TaxID=2920385 RepID=A0ABS9RZF7_9GAMM|nr:type II toxin-antitoxin system RelE/ParE family toxin [Halomonas flagellata]MCH4565140.1 type II toxin-antitoxin system RelE/ParE family toxin [Halomonas flagellata]
MKIVSETETYAAWFAKLRHQRAKAKILARIRRVELGNFGDYEPVGEGVSEFRIHYGPEYRVYFVQRGFELVILLAGGDKSSQAKDIEIAKQLARDLKEVP